MKQHACLLLFLTILTLSACAPFRPSDSRAAVCNELNSQIIFSGGTSNVRKAEIQQSEEPLMHRTYYRHKCDVK